jgi:DNA processing protein
LEQNRELFALPGNADSKFSLGTNRLIQKGLAKLVLKAEDILEEISPNQRDFQLRIEDACPPISDSAISSDEERVMRILSEKKSHRDVIADELDISIAKIQAILTTLEIKGLVVSKPGAIFEIVE